MEAHWNIISYSCTTVSRPYIIGSFEARDTMRDTEEEEMVAIVAGEAMATPCSPLPRQLDAGPP